MAKSVSRVLRRKVFLIRLYIVLLSLILVLALLAGCTSADPNNPYGQEPAEGNPGATTEETAAVLIYEQA